MLNDVRWSTMVTGFKIDQPGYLAEEISKQRILHVFMFPLDASNQIT